MHPSDTARGTEVFRLLRPAHPMTADLTPMCDIVRASLADLKRLPLQRSHGRSRRGDIRSPPLSVHPIASARYVQYRIEPIGTWERSTQSASTSDRRMTTSRGTPHFALWSSAACNAGVNAVTALKPSFS